MALPPSALETKLNLKALTLLIVDGNEFSRSFTRNVCASFRFDKVLTAASVKEAVDHMTAVEPQLMLVDWLLPPDSGEGLIRKVRRMMTIRNPFVPIIVLSGSNDKESIAAARDAGAHEFVPRPFDLKVLLHRFGQVLLTPRPFISVDSYVGPDRRRKQQPYDGPDRRVEKRNGVKPSSSAAAAAKAAAPGGATLRTMAASGEKVIVAEEVRYRAVRRQDLDDLAKLFEQLRRLSTPDLGVTEQIYLKSHALKAMGETFGFPLLTDAGDSLCRLVWKLPAERTLAPITIQGIEQHVRTMKLIVDQDIRHDGGSIGAQLIQGLRTLVSRAAS